LVTRENVTSPAGPGKADGGLFGDQRAVAGGAGLRVLPPQGFRIESRSVRVKSLSRESRVAGEAIPLRMATDAALQILPRGLAMPEQEVLLGVMIAGVQRALGTEPGLDVAVGAELSGIVAVAAAGLAGVGRSRVAGEESGRVVARRGIRRIRPVTVEALGTHMAAFAGLRLAVRHRAVNLGKILPVRRGTSAVGDGALPAPGTTHRKHLHRRRFAQVTGETTLLRVAGGAFARGFPGDTPVTNEKFRVVVTGRSLQLGADGQRAWIGSEGLDHPNFRSVHVTLGAEIPRVAGGARSGYALASRLLRQLAMKIEPKSGITMVVRSGKVRHVLPGQPGGQRKRKVTRCAAGVGRREMGSLDPMTIEAALHHCKPNIHASPPLGMARLTAQHRILLDPPHRHLMVPVSKTEVRSGQLRGWLPFYSLLDSIIVAGSAVFGRGPERLPCLENSGVTTGASRKQLPMFPVIELLSALGECGLGCGTDHKHCERGTSKAHRVPEGGRERIARGSGVRSAPLPRKSVMPARSRVWFQSNPLASGRRRSSR